MKGWERRNEECYGIPTPEIKQAIKSPVHQWHVVSVNAVTVIALR
jgi:hypothetical protein